ncbi:hypothetical protein [Edaphobacter sp.]|uniref:hypothetical protein n=1 Tax=Edaphobacter sp. TaxID=1934404 RepID=UPI002DB9393A|nr:hypothetical protein [Edaphobacter sp.]HEU5342235.1 hypothetical protein [Edaphobacter sp.]
MAVGMSFYDTDKLRQIATNLFYGWGYNFYRTENQLRSDDQLVRSKAAWLLGIAMASVTAAETEYRREFLPPPSRVKPFPDAAAVASAQKLELLAKGIGALEAAIQQQPVPENDRMTQRFRQEAATLRTLIEHDEKLVGQCELMRSMVDQQTGMAILEKIADLEGGLGAIRGTLQQRETVLHGVTQ